MIEGQLGQVLTAVLGALVYSIVFFVKQKGDELPENFNPTKFVATIVVGVLVGTTFALSGQDLEFAAFHEEMLMYAGTVALVESILKTMWKKYRNSS